MGRRWGSGQNRASRAEGSQSMGLSLPPPRNRLDQGPQPTCRWVMFLSMFMGDVTQF